MTFDLDTWIAELAAACEERRRRGWMIAPEVDGHLGAGLVAPTCCPLGAWHDRARSLFAPYDPFYEHPTADEVDVGTDVGPFIAGFDGQLEDGEAVPPKMHFDPLFQIGQRFREWYGALPYPQGDDA